MLVVHGHGRGTRLGMCLVQQQCVSCVTLQHVLVFPFLHWAGACTRHGTRPVYAWPLLQASPVLDGVAQRRTHANSAMV